MKARRLPVYTVTLPSPAPPEPFYAPVRGIRRCFACDGLGTVLEGGWRMPCRCLDEASQLSTVATTEADSPSLARGSDPVGETGAGRAADQSAPLHRDGDAA